MKLKLFLAAVGLTVAACSSCALVQRSEAPFEKCAQSDIASMVTNVAPAVVAILDHEPATAQTALESLGPLGVDVVVCAVEAIVSGMQEGKSMSVPPTSQVQVLKSGKAYLTAKGLPVK